MTFGITVNRPPLQNAPIYELFETRRQKIAGGERRRMLPAG